MYVCVICDGVVESVCIKRCEDESEDEMKQRTKTKERKKKKEMIEEANNGLSCNATTAGKQSTKCTYTERGRGEEGKEE